MSEADARLSEARALLAGGHYSEARKAAKACLKLRKGDASALALLDVIDEHLARQEQSAPRPQASAPGTEWRVGAVVLEDYTIEKKLGEGGMGAVYLVRSVTGQRFAVKTVLARDLGDEASRQAFFRELQTWIDLPEHPHLAACRFFRTAGDRLAIFADAIDGGSLDRWVAERRLTQLGAALDVAIQSAWGLEAAHQAGVIHRDVKPANMLLTRDGVVKISDFGLARALPSMGSGRQSIESTSSGMSAAYCSPEQATGEPLTPRTDMWSWAVSVLEIFLGRIPCRFGPQAPAEMAALQDGTTEGVLALPAPVAAVLDRCFRVAPEERWTSMGQLARELQRVYLDLTGQAYPRLAPAPSRSARNRGQGGHERALGGVTWGDPRRWLLRAIEEEGQGAEAPAEHAEPGQSRDVWLIGEMALFDQAARTLERLIARGRADLEETFAALCQEKAFVHLALADYPGAIHSLDAAIQPLTRLHRQGRADLTRSLVLALGNKANFLRATGDARAAVTLYDQGIALLEPLVAGGREDLKKPLASLLTNQATLSRAFGDNQAAVRLHDRAIALWETLAPGSHELTELLASALMNKAISVRELGDARTSVALHERAASLQHALVEQHGSVELRNDLATTCMNAAMAHRDLGDNQAALALCEQALALRERLVHEEGREEFAHDLALALTSKALIAHDLGDVAGATAANERAIAIWEQLVYQQGRLDLASSLTLAYTNLSDELRLRGDLGPAMLWNDRALALLERLINQEDQLDQATVLASARANRISLLRALGHDDAALDSSRQAEAQLRALRERGMSDLDVAIAWIQLLRAKLLLDHGEIALAREDALRGMGELQAEIARTGRPELLEKLVYAMDHLGPVLGPSAPGG